MSLTYSIMKLKLKRKHPYNKFNLIILIPSKCPLPYITKAHKFSFMVLDSAIWVDLTTKKVAIWSWFIRILYLLWANRQPETSSTIIWSRSVNSIGCISDTPPQCYLSKENIGLRELVAVIYFFPGFYSCAFRSLANRKALRYFKGSHLVFIKLYRFCACSSTIWNCI